MSYTEPPKNEIPEGGYDSPKNKGKLISVAEAKDKVKRYKGKYQNAKKAHFFGDSVLKEFLELPRCVGIRVYPVLNKDGSQTVLLVGVDSEGNNLFFEELVGKNDQDSYVYESTVPCPKFCPNPPSDL